MADIAPPLPSRFPRLDGVRGVAILLVLMHQFSLLGAPAGILGRTVDLVLDRGWIGVQLFFVLSGFLITGILLDARGKPGAWTRFALRRVLRIFPLYFLALLLFTIMLPRLGLVPADWSGHAVWYWLFVSNWTQAFVGGALPHFWSLAVEEQFYVLWPLAALVRERKVVLASCAALVLLAVAFRLAMRHGQVSPEAIYMATVSRMDALACGAAAAVLIRMPRVREGIARWEGPLWGAALALLAAGFLLTHYDRTSPTGQVWGYLILSLDMGAGILLLAAADASRAPSRMPSGWLAGWPLRRLGLYSYAMYVFHKPLHDLVGRPLLAAAGLGNALAPGPGLAYLAAAIVATAAVGALSYHAFERHFLALGRTPPAGMGGGREM